MAKKKTAETGIVDTTEQKRLNEAREAGIPWKKWGPYLSERQWGTVREDYSADGNAWDYFTHDQSRSRAYRWGEDGLGGFSDDQQRLCFALALWNERDPILKERAFGLTNSEGNHGEDVKEYYFYLDSTPTHSYMKYLYKYPQREFPYRDLVETNRRANAGGARVRAPRHGDLRRRPLLRRLPRVRQGGPGRHPDPRVGPQPRPGGGPAAAPADALVPEHLVVGRRGRRSRSLREKAGRDRGLASRARRVHALVRRRARAAVHGERDATRERLWGQPNPTPYVKDAFHRYVVSGENGRGEPGEDRHEGRRALRPRRAGGRLRVRPAPPVEGRRRAEVRRGVRGGAPAAAPRRRRVLRADHAALARRGRAPGPPPGARRDALDEAVLLLRPRPLAEGAPGAPAPRRRGPRRPERRVVPHAERRRHLDARQVGVPLVRGLGPRLPHDRALARGLRLRQGAAPPDAAEPLQPPERADARRTSGTSATSTRRSTPGRRSSSTSWRRTSAARTSSSWSARSRA